MKNKDIKNIDSFHDYMTTTDPANPFGFNYELKEKHAKINTKFKQMKKYVNIEDEDKKNLFQGYIYFYTGCATAFMVPFMPVLLIKNIFPNFKLFKSRIIYTSFQILLPSFTLSLAYKPLFIRMLNDYQIPILKKYMSQAVENGFYDYKISPYIGKVSLLDSQFYDKYYPLPELDEI